MNLDRSPRPTHASLVKGFFTGASGDAFGAVDWHERTVKITDPDGHVAFVCEEVETPVQWSNLAVAVVARRYFTQGTDVPEERSVRALIQRVIGTIASWALEAGHVSDRSERDLLQDELTALVLTQRATFATTVWLNTGLREHPVTSACFILKAGDSIPELLEWNTREGLIFQQGGGAGINLSTIRSSREPVSLGGMASGPVSFMRATDAWAATIRAGGRARRGAKMVVLDASHPDILEFVEAKAREEDRGRALVEAGYAASEVAGSLAFQHANHSVRVSDEFMRLAIEGGDWPLRAVKTGEVLETISARELLSACAQAAARCGDPGLLFADQITRWHTCPNTGPVTASNPCGEFLNVDESACNLATLNLLAFSEGGEMNIEAFTAAVETLVLAQDAIIDGSGYPSDAIEHNTKRLRSVGLGYANLGALLLSLGIAYDSDQALTWAAAVTALMTGVAYRRSAELASRLGPFAEFERNREEMLAVIERQLDGLDDLDETHAPELLQAAQREWTQALALGRLHGFRNAHVTLVPPTGTVSLMLDCETTGIEPYYALTTVKRFADGGEVRMVSRAVVDGLRALGHTDPVVERLSEYALDHGRLADSPELRPHEQHVFRTAVGPSALTPMAHLRMVAAVQPFLSGGVSKTVPLSADADAETVEQVFIDAWRLGLKSVAVYLDGSKLSQPLTSDED